MPQTNSTDHYTVENCRTCNARIIWVITRAGKNMPVNAEPSTGGNIELRYSGRTYPLAIVLSQRAAAEQAAAGVGLHISHFVTCPDAPAWRKR